MARKLKSDKVLFFATLLLVFASIVMVYSASAVMAMERFHRPYLFLIKQSMWAALGLAALAIVMRVDYRLYRQPAVIWASLAVVGVGLWLVLLSPPINGTRRWFGARRLRRAAVRAGQAVADPVHGRPARAPHAPRQRRALRAAADRHLVSALVVVLVLLEPDFGTAVSMLIVVALMVFAAGLDWRYFAAVALAAHPDAGRHRDRGSVPAARASRRS